ncbi:hypothetical protein FRB99_000425 [Tulasnella sp. 403]|nr:hypothetical protein FRB99_000425 [Tulasnella sp. 403]
MADLYSNQYAPRLGTNNATPKDDSQYPPYPIQTDMDTRDDKHPPSPPQPQQDPHKLDTKPQATFLTKLYALLERPEYQSMIRWDQNGEQIIVERPEQLALHVLPSIYRQSRFASFSRQLNIYGFMRKVNLRNVDPAIDDPDASTWSHPTLNRFSPPEVVANFKRRVPPRLPKQQRKRSEATDLPRLDIPPHHALPSSSLHVPSNAHPHHQLAGGIGLPQVPMSMAVAANDLGVHKNRPRGISAPGAYGNMSSMSHSSMGGITPISTPSSATFPSSASKWGPPSAMGVGGNYSRNALPPISIPSSSNTYGAPTSAYPNSQNSSIMSGISPADHGSYGAPHSAYGSNHHSAGIPGLRDSNSVFAYDSYGPNDAPPSASSTHPNWGSSYLPPASSLASGGSPSHGPSGGSLSSILNPSGSSNNYPSRPTLNTSTSFPSPFSTVPPHHPQGNSLSPDSRPTTGYSVGSSSLPYELDSATTGTADSSRPLTPASLRPSSAKSLGGPSSTSHLRHGRPRRRSDAVGNPYPSPYYDGQGAAGLGNDLRPVTAPEGGSGGMKAPGGGGIQLPSVSGLDAYHFSTGQNADFAYSPTHPTGNGGHDGGVDSWTRNLRPSTSASSISAASTSMIHTPPIMEDAENEANTTVGGGGGARAHSISTPSSGDMDNDISRYTSATDFLSLSTLSSTSPELRSPTTTGHHGGISPMSLTPLDKLINGTTPLDKLLDVGIKPSDIDFGDPLREGSL